VMENDNNKKKKINSTTNVDYKNKIITLA